MNEHIYPVFARLLQRADRERRLRQHSKVLWLTGLSGSGKSTIAQELERRLFNEGYFPQALDGDNLRSGINQFLDFTDEGRRENIRRASEISKLYANSGIIVINSFISPTRAIRQMAREIIGEEDFVEIYVNAPLEACEARDVKGLYQRARAGQIKGFTGIDAPYEPPENPHLELRTDQMNLHDCVRALFEFLEPIIKYRQQTTDNRSQPHEL